MPVSVSAPVNAGAPAVVPVARIAPAPVTLLPLTVSGESPNVLAPVQRGIVSMVPVPPTGVPPLLVGGY